MSIPSDKTFFFYPATLALEFDLFFKKLTLVYKSAIGYLKVKPKVIFRPRFGRIGQYCYM